MLPVAAASRPKEIAEAYVASLTLGIGQFCTKPVLLFAPSGSSVLEEASAAVAASTGGPALSDHIRDGYRSFMAWDGLPVIATGAGGDAVLAMTPELRAVNLRDFTANTDDLAVEHFGPAGLLVTYPDVVELLATLPGCPAASPQPCKPTRPTPGTPRVAEVSRRRVGRLIMNGWPTGVAVCAAQHHGGPWPTTTDARYTSVGAKAIERWLVPIVYQDWPDELLPEELRRDNPLGVPRQIES